MDATDLAATIDQFSSLFDHIRNVSAPQAPLDPQALAEGLQQQPPDQAVQQLAQRVALSTPLTEDAARPMVQRAFVAQQNDVLRAAQQVSSQLSGFAVSGELQLSKPNPLSWPWRTVFAVVMLGIMIAALVLSAIAHSTGAAEYVALGILGGLGWLGSVLFVMGYQKVDLKGSSGPNSGGANQSLSAWALPVRCGVW